MGEVKWETCPTSPMVVILMVAWLCLQMANSSQAPRGPDIQLTTMIVES